MKKKSNRVPYRVLCLKSHREIKSDMKALERRIRELYAQRDQLASSLTDLKSVYHIIDAVFWVDDVPLMLWEMNDESFCLRHLPDEEENAKRDCDFYLNQHDKKTWVVRPRTLLPTRKEHSCIFNIPSKEEALQIAIHWVLHSSTQLSHNA